MEQPRLLHGNAGKSGTLPEKPETERKRRTGWTGENGQLTAGQRLLPSFAVDATGRRLRTRRNDPHARLTWSGADHPNESGREARRSEMRDNHHGEREQPEYEPMYRTAAQTYRYDRPVENAVFRLMEAEISVADLLAEIGWE